MKIGILTFHWATNYGAVLQCYALQSYLESLGHEVKIINYKPLLYDFSIKTFLRELKKGYLNKYIESIKKEHTLKTFRKMYLNQTNRIVSINDLPNACVDFDCIISGSDQVMNPMFLTFGEGKCAVTPSYYLGFDFRGKRIGYAVSFGVVDYPACETEIAKPFIAKFDKIGTRENSGIKIIETMGRKDSIVVPDPTILLTSEVYNILANASSIKSFADNYCFFIRHIKERKSAINSLQLPGSSLWNNDDGDYALEGWLAKINNAKFVVTDSFHCIVMCLKLHTPFVVVTELHGNTGMNDRLYTLLGCLSMENRIVFKSDIAKICAIREEKIKWNGVDQELNKYKSVGIEFLKSI